MLCIPCITIFILSQNFYGSLAAQAWWKLVGAVAEKSRADWIREEFRKLSA